MGGRYVLAAAVLWSLSGVLAKSFALDPISVAFYRSLFAGLALLPFVPRARWEFRSSMLPNVVVFGAMIGAYLASVKLTTAANAIFLQFTATFWMVPLSYLMLRERPDRGSLIGIALAMVGVLTIVLWGYVGKSGEVWGVALGLASGICYAWVAVGMRRLRGLDPIWLSAVNNLGGALALGAWAVVLGQGLARPTATEALWLLGFGVVQMAVPYALFARGLRDLGAPKAGLIGLLEPLLNPVWVYLVHGERPAPATRIGAVFLLAGVLAPRLWKGR
jgi:drug/metabolite transporter (DMT)-like permease